MNQQTHHTERLAKAAAAIKSPGISHIEVLDAKNREEFKAGQLLRVVRETPAFYHVLSHGGVEWRVSKKTKRLIGTLCSFVRTSAQPTTNL
jgi:hypothetical protein